MASLELRKVVKRYDAAEIVKGVDLKIEDGEFIVLVGPSGCGKSTTLRMIAGLESITAGELQIGERVVNALSPRERDVAMVFQSYALYPHMTVFENMAFGLRLRKMPEAEIRQRVQEAAQILELGPLLDRKPKNMSGGQRQRVAMGRAIVRQPAVFLFDEPLSNLDAKLRVQMRAEIAKLHRRLGITTVYVTHDQVEAMTLAQRIVVMNGGVVQQVGAPLELYRRPANTFVGSFIGSPSMNFFDVQLDPSQKTLQGEGFCLPLPARLAPHVGEAPRALTLGVRPEHMRHVEGAESGELIPAQVEVLEPLGADVFALGKVGQTPVTARLEPDTAVQLGDRIGLAVDPAQAHLFDAATGESVLP